ncbi:MAG: hypothetical protein IJU70_12245, partial [Lentisphaeria bacterium]|nr:hypothetical protein [Lentisphaeria bacterium]
MRILTGILSAACCFFAAGAWEIVIPREALPVTVTAAEELKTHLDRALGRETAVVREDGAGPGRKIYLGNTR